jgi:hypothetical protein
MGSTTMEVGRLISLVVGAGCVFLATRPSGRTRAARRDQRPAARPTSLPHRPDDNGLAHLRLSAAGRNRWDRTDLSRGIGFDPAVGEPGLAVWPASPFRTGSC